MTPKLTKGFIALAKKSLAIISSSVASISGLQGKSEFIIDNSNITIENSNFSEQRLGLAPKLILKLNRVNLEKRSFYLHTSHSSHSSHSSHASHASHYSSSPNYPTPTPNPYIPPVTPIPPQNTQPPKSYSTVSPATTSSRKNDTSLLIEQTVFRTLFRGCEGNDVLKLQNLLIVIGYYNLNTGYFGDKTEMAVIKFQLENELKPDGRVTYKVYLAIRNKLR